MARKAWLRLLLVVGLVLHTGAPFVVDRGNTNTANDILKEHKQLPQERDLNNRDRDTNTSSSLPSITTTTSTTTTTTTTTTDVPECNLPPAVVEEIRSYQEVVDRIIDYVVNGEYKGQAYQHLASLVDTFGSRLSGTGELEAAIDWMIAKSHAENLENVHAEDVLVPHWVRNRESAWMTLPRSQELNIVGLGSSVATPLEGITAQVLVVRDFKDLEEQGAKAAGKIVVYNPEWISYSDTVKYRSEGASRAARLGAVAALVRSVTPFSINSPHTGQQFYSSDNKIPVACITVEDAAMMERIQARGDTIEVKLSMDAQTYPDMVSRNTMVEVQGGLQPNETVIVSGHLDSWDVGQGAMDDGGGMTISWAAVVVLRRMGLRPRRTVRGILWTGEEEGIIGGYAYYNRHKHEHEQYQLMLESDIGTFTPRGLAFHGSPEATCILKEVMKLLHHINATQVGSPMDGGPDIQMWQEVGVPTGSLMNANERYFWFHHSGGDTLSVEDPDELDRCLALWTSVAYVTADMKERLPHSPPSSSTRGGNRHTRDNTSTTSA